MDLDPARIVPVTDFSAETLRSLVALLEISVDFDHLVYREAELDAIWSITGFYLRDALDADNRHEVSMLHQGAHQAHDFVAAGRPREAAALLRSFL